MNEMDVLKNRWREGQGHTHLPGHCRSRRSVAEHRGVRIFTEIHEPQH